MSADDPTYGDEPDDELIAEARWPMAGAVLAAMVLTILLPNRFRLLPGVVVAGARGRDCCSR